MPISIIDNFQVNKFGPIDDRIIATSSSARNSISYKYDGLKVFQTDNRRNYIWNSDTSTWDNEDYEEGIISIGSFINLYGVGPINTLFFAAGGSSSGHLKYIKVGKLVTISGQMSLNWTLVNAISYGSHQVQLVLPFSPSSSPQGGIGMHLVCPQWTENSSAPYGGTICIQNVGGNPVILKYHRTGSTVSEPTVDDFISLNSGLCDLFITITYISES